MFQRCENIFIMSLLCCCVLLTACTTTHGLCPWRFHHNETPPTPALNLWSLQGAIGVKNGEKGFNANIHWQEKSKTVYRIRLYGSFGAGASLLEADESGVLFTDNKKQQYKANTASELLKQQTQWDIPVEYLHDWVLAKPVPNLASAIERNKEGHLVQLIQAGWIITYDRYVTVNAQRVLPTKINLAKDNLRVRIVIRHWEIQ